MAAIEQYPAPGNVLAGKYRVEAMLGEGGMGAVFRATEIAGPSAGRPVAIKFTSLEVRNRPGIAGRFANEALAASRIASEHAVKIYGVEATTDGTPFIVMELLQGKDLDQIVETDAPLGAERAVHFALQILRALQVAHGVGVVHRDLKPSNCYVVQHEGESDFVKLIDFGITKILGDEASQLTKTSTTLGTPAYMAPEQAKSAKAADPRSDLYSMGVILYELLTKRRPFDGDSHNALVVRICTEPPVPLRTHRADLPSGLVAAVERALVKSPPGRYQTAREFAETLRPFAGRQSAAVLARLAAGAIGTPVTPPPAISPAAPAQVGLPQTTVRVGAPQNTGFAMANTPLSEEPQRAFVKIAGSTAPMNGLDVGGAQTAPIAPPQRPEPARQQERTLLGEVGPMDFSAATDRAPAGAAPIAQPRSPMSPAMLSQPSSTEDREGGSGHGALFVVLGVLAIGLIAFGVYTAASGRSSSPAPTTPPAPRTATSTDDNADDTVAAPKKKKHEDEAIVKSATIDDTPIAMPTSAATPQHPGMKPHPTTTGSPAAIPAPAPTLPFPFPFPFPGEPAAKPPPPSTATTGAPPAPPPAPTLVAPPTPAPTDTGPKKPKIGGAGF